MKIVIDCRFWGPGHSGLGVYTQKLVEHLADLDNTNNYVLIFQKGIRNDSFPENFQVVEIDIPVYSVQEQLFLPLKLAALRPDLVHFVSINVPLLYFGRYVVTIHDLIKHHSRGTQTTTRSPLLYWLKYLGYRIVFSRLISFAGKIIVPSQTVKDELASSLMVNPEKVSVTYEAPTIENVPAENISGLPKRFGLYVGNAYPHKNLPTLIKAWSVVFEKTGLKLLLAGGRTAFSSRIEDHIRKGNAKDYVVSTGYLTPGQLVSVYQDALLYVFPSKLEGFGLPGLDAMAMDVPVVCSDIAVLKEVYGQAAHYFAPTDPSDIAKKVMEVIENLNLRTKLVEAGKRRAAKFSWQKTARETLQVYESSFSLRSS